MRGHLGSEEEVSALKYRNMVAERRLTAMMLREEVEQWTGLEYLPSSTQNQERVVQNVPRESMVEGPVLPCWGSSGGPGAGSNHRW